MKFHTFLHFQLAPSFESLSDFLSLSSSYPNQSTSTSMTSPSEEEEEEEGPALLLLEPPNQSAAGPHVARRASSSALRLWASCSLCALEAPACAKGSSSSGASQ